jgi:hypothetical protein
MDLNHARLPIPPRWQVDLVSSGSSQPPNQEDLQLFILQTVTAVSNQRTSQPDRYQRSGKQSTDQRLQASPEGDQEIAEPKHQKFPRYFDQRLQNSENQFAHYATLNLLWSPKRGGPLLQLSVHRNLRVQHLRDRTSFLGVFGALLEGRGIRARDFSHDVDMAGRDRPSRIQFLQ